jgi:tetratricopeptide (TPR) repeat protein
MRTAKYLRSVAVAATIVLLLEIILGTTAVILPSASASPSAGAASVSPTSQDSCTDADDLLAAGQNSDAKTAFEALLKSQPDLPCALEGLKQSEAQSQIRLCAEGNALESAGQLDAAKTDFEAAIGAAASSAPDDCAVQGLAHVTSEQNAIAPSWWSTGQHAITRWGLGFLWMLLALAVGAALLMGAFGWTIRGLRRWIAHQSRLRLVPRVRLVPLSGPAGNGSADNLTALLRSQMQAVQTSDEVKLDFVATDTRVQGLVTAP